MRPDQHKQKRSAQYQKKHGKKDNKNSEENKVDKKESSGNQSGKTTHTSTSQRAPVTGAGTTQVSGVGQSGTHISAVSEDETQQSFRRREVKSNWSRYEDLKDEDDAVETQRGADFGQLLQVTSDALSQFRFKSEQAWEDETEENEEALNTYLSVDIAGLAKHMQAIPLHRRLNMDPNIFPAEMLKLFEEEASMYRSEQTTASQIHHQGETDQCNQTEDTVTKSANLFTNEKDELDDILDLDMCNDDSRTNDTELNKDTQKTEEKASLPSKEITAENITDDLISKEVEKDEDDLDFLLSLTTTVNKQETVTEIKEECDIHKKPEPPGVISTPDTAVNKEEGFKPSKTENLEDWLDSVLDD